MFLTALNYLLLANKEDLNIIFQAERRSIDMEARDALTWLCVQAFFSEMETAIPRNINPNERVLARLGREPFLTHGADIQRAFIGYYTTASANGGTIPAGTVLGIAAAPTEGAASSSSHHAPSTGGGPGVYEHDFGDTAATPEKQYPDTDSEHLYYGGRQEMPGAPYAMLANPGDPQRYRLRDDFDSDHDNFPEPTIGPDVEEMRRRSQDILEIRDAPNQTNAPEVDEDENDGWKSDVDEVPSPNVGVDLARMREVSERMERIGSILALPVRRRRIAGYDTTNRYARRFLTDDGMKLFEHSFNYFLDRVVEGENLNGLFEVRNMNDLTFGALHWLFLNAYLNKQVNEQLGNARNFEFRPVSVVLHTLANPPFRYNWESFVNRIKTFLERLLDPKVPIGRV